VLIYPTEFPSYKAKCTVLLEGVQYPIEIDQKIIRKAQQLGHSYENPFLEGTHVAGTWAHHEALTKLTLVLHGDPTKIKPNMSRETLALTEDELDAFADTAMKAIKNYFQTLISNAPKMRSPYLFPRFQEISEVAKYFHKIPVLAPQPDITKGVRVHPNFCGEGATTNGGGVRYHKKGSYSTPHRLEHNSRTISELTESLKTTTHLIIVADVLTSQAMSKAMEVFNSNNDYPGTTLVVVLGLLRNHPINKLLGPKTTLTHDAWNDVIHNGRPIHVRVMKRARALTFFRSHVTVAAVRNKSRPIRFHSANPNDAWTLPTIKELQAPPSEDHKFFDIPIKIKSFSANWRDPYGATLEFTSIVHMAAHAQAVQNSRQLTQTPADHLTSLAAKIRFIGVTPATYTKIGVPSADRVRQITELTASLILANYRAAVPGTVVRNCKDLWDVHAYAQVRNRVPTPEGARFDLNPRIAFHAVRNPDLADASVEGLPKTSRATKFIIEAEANPFKNDNSALLVLIMYGKSIEKKGLYDIVTHELCAAITPKGARKLARHLVIHNSSLIPLIAPNKIDKEELRELIF